MVVCDSFRESLPAVETQATSGVRTTLREGQHAPHGGRLVFRAGASNMPEVLNKAHRFSRSSRRNRGADLALPGALPADRNSSEFQLARQSQWTEG